MQSIGGAREKVRYNDLDHGSPPTSMYQNGFSESSSPLRIAGRVSPTFISSLREANHVASLTEAAAVSGVSRHFGDPGGGNSNDVQHSNEGVVLRVLRELQVQHEARVESLLLQHEGRILASVTASVTASVIENVLQLTKDYAEDLVSQAVSQVKASISQIPAASPVLSLAAIRKPNLANADIMSSTSFATPKLSEGDATTSKPPAELPKLFESKEHTPEVSVDEQETVSSSSSSANDMGKVKSIVQKASEAQAKQKEAKNKTKATKASSKKSGPLMRLFVNEPQDSSKKSNQSEGFGAQSSLLEGRDDSDVVKMSRSLSKGSGSLTTTHCRATLRAARQSKVVRHESEQRADESESSTAASKKAGTRKSTKSKRKSNRAMVTEVSEDEKSSATKDAEGEEPKQRGKKSLKTSINSRKSASFNLDDMRKKDSVVTAGGFRPGKGQSASDDDDSDDDDDDDDNDKQAQQLKKGKSTSVRFNDEQKPDEPSKKKFASPFKSSSRLFGFENTVVSKFCGNNGSKPKSDGSPLDDRQQRPRMTAAAIAQQEVQNLRRSTKMCRLSWTAYQEEKEFEQRRKEKKMTTRLDSSSLTRISSSDITFTIQKKCRQISRSRYFDVFCAILIISNAAVLGAQTDWSAKNIGEDMPSTFVIASMSFTLAFTMELSIRMIAIGLKKFVFSRDWRWNLFDIFIVISGLLEESLIIYALTSGVNINSQGDAKKFQVVSMLSILRLVRITRVLRVMQFSRDLRIMLYGIWNSLRSLMWAILLLLLVMFCVSVCVTQVITDRIVEGSISKEYGDKHLYEYRTLTRAAYGLFKAISGGVDWGTVADPLIVVSPILIILFGIYIAFAVFCVLNVVTGVFVENTKRITDTDIDHIVMDAATKKAEFLIEVERLWNELNIRCISGEADTPDNSAFGLSTTDSMSLKIQQKDFESATKDMRIQAYFKKVGLFVEAYNAGALFKIMDSDHDGFISFTDFAFGCEQLRGEAQKLDITRLRIESRNVSNSLKALEDGQNQHFRQVLTATNSANFAELKGGLNTLGKFCSDQFVHNHAKHQQLLDLTSALLAEKIEVSPQETQASIADTSGSQVPAPSAELPLPECPWPENDPELENGHPNDFLTPKIGCVAKLFQTRSESRGSDDLPPQGPGLKTGKPGTIGKIRKGKH